MQNTNRQTFTVSRIKWLLFLVLSLESLALNGGFPAIAAVIELSLSATILAAGTSRILLILLAGWITLTLRLPAATLTAVVNGPVRDLT